MDPNYPKLLAKIALQSAHKFLRFPYDKVKMVVRELTITKANNIA